MRKGIKVKQRDSTDCGAACLASVSAYYGQYLPVSRIRQYAGTDAKGTNVLGLLEAAEQLGFEAKGVRGEHESLSEIPLPAIAHMILENGVHHYVVIYKVNKKWITVMDPGDGRISRRSSQAFLTEWSGAIVLLLPGDTFEEDNEQASHVTRFWQLVQPHRGIMLLSLAGALVYTILGLSFSVYIQKIIDIVLVEGNARLLNLLSVIMIVLLLFQLFIGAFKTILGLQVAQHIDARLVLGYYKHLLQLPQRFFDTMRIGEIISRVNDAVKIRLFINDTVQGIIVNMLIVVVSVALMFLYYWKLALIMLAIIPFYVAIYLVSNRVHKKWQRVIMEENASLEAQLVESLNAVGTIKRFGLEAYAGNKTENKFIILLRSIYRSSIKGVYTATASEYFTRLFTVLILWAGSYFVIDRELTPGELLSFYALIGYFTGPATALLGANKAVQEALIAADRLFEIIDLDIEADDKYKLDLSLGPVGEICFRNVHFGYGTRRVVFEGLTMLIEHGSCTAIVGESGSGKSTLLSLLQHLYPLKEGDITISGFDIRFLSNKTLRRWISVVPQQIDLFTGTIMENICIGDPNPDIERILFLAQMLGIDEFVTQLPEGYNSMVNEQGMNLSGGQRQRLAIARALYRDPKILILDEATASLDPVSEQRVHDALLWFRKQKKTVIIIAHRLSTTRHCDNILVLQNGRVVEGGTHEVLLRKEGCYKRMWQYFTETAPG